MFNKKFLKELEINNIKGVIIVCLLGLAICMMLLIPQIRQIIINTTENFLIHRELKDHAKWHRVLFNISIVGSVFFVLFPFCFSVIRNFCKNNASNILSLINPGLLAQKFVMDVSHVFSLIISGLSVKKLVSLDRLSQITIIFFLVAGIMYAHTKAHFNGEADSYVIATISLQQHASLDVREGDIHQLESEGYPSYFVERARNKFENRRYINDVYGKQYPWYMGTYSISVLPIKMINVLFNMPQTNIYHVSNVLYYSLALLVVYFCFRQTRKNIFLTILLLVCSPTFVYISWASAEMFICSLMIVALVFYANGNRHLAALFMAIASTLNITICGFGIVMLADYFISVYNNEKRLNGKWNTLTAIKRNWKKTFTLVICFIPALITPLWNLYHYHKITPQIGAAQYDIFWLKRFVAYLFDLNFGFLPYFPVLLALFFVIIIIGIFKKERQAIMLALGFFITVFLYSAMTHINCGMTAIARYNSWSFPFLVIAVVFYFDKFLKNNKRKHIVVFFMIFSAGSSFALTKMVMDYNGGSFIYFTPIAKLFFDKAPALYNPYPFTFISRHQHYDGGYDRNANIPFVYYSDDGLARKVLIPPKCDDPVSFFKFALSGAENDISWLNEKAKKLKTNHPLDWTYLNVPLGRNIIINENNVSVTFAKPFLPKDTSIIYTDDRDIYKEFIRMPKDYPSYKLGENIGLANNKSIYQTFGWSGTEEWGTWTEGKIAFLVMSVDNSNNLFLHLNIAGVFNNIPIDMYINNVIIGSFEFAFGENIIEIPKEIYPDNLLKIIFKIKDPKSPMDMGLSGDTRKLGIGVSSFYIDTQ